MFKNNKIEELEQEIQKLKEENLELTEKNTKLRSDNMEVAHYRFLYENEQSHNETLRQTLYRKETNLHDQAIKFNETVERLMNIPIDKLGEQEDVEIVFCKTYRGGFKLYHNGEEIDLTRCRELRISWYQNEYVTVEVDK